MTLYCGIDLHSNNSVISIIDDNDQLIQEKRMPNDLALICELLAPHQNDLHGIVIESTYNWYWLVDGLMEADYPVHLANTLAIQQYQGLKHTNDETDARFLAHLLRLNILPTGFIYPKQLRSVRDLLRRRLLLVKQRTTQIISLQSTLDRHTACRITSDKIKRLTREKIHELVEDATLRFTLCQSMQLIQQLNIQIKTIEEFVFAHCDPKQYALITSIPGVGLILGMTILLETGPISRFPKVGNYSSYARCVPSNKISNGKSKGRGNTRNGNRYLAIAFGEAAHYATIWSPTIKAYYQRKLKKVPLMVAKKSIANKLTRACYHMMVQQVPFDQQRAFG